MNQPDQPFLSTLGPKNRVAITLLPVLFGWMLVCIMLNPGPTIACPRSDEQPEAVFTSTYSVYLPMISHEIACMNPPDGTVMVGGQATVHGQPAGAGIPFRLLYSAHWDARPSYILTATTRSGGEFCFGPVDMLPYRGSWYVVVFDPEWVPDEDYVLWTSPMLLYGKIEAEEVYTFTAEIGEEADGVKELSGLGQ